MITTDQTVQTFLDFFRERGHELTPGGSLIPSPGDPVLFTTSGMHPLTPYLMGRPHPLGQRLTSLQRCLRTTDLEEIGDDTHLTVFEMLGSWSLGDYGGPQSLRWGFELLRDGFGIDPGRMYVTVFGGDEHLEPDHESWRTWDGRGHVLRRLIRRTLTTLWRDDPTRTLSDLPIELVEHTLGHFRQSVHSREVRTILLDEERKFDLLLQRGRKVLSHSRFTGPLTDDDYHYLHDTHGLPRDLVVYLNTEAGVS